MARKQGYVRNAKAIARIAKTDQGIKAAIHAIAAQGAERAGGHVEDYVTDRAVSAVVVTAQEQAKNGAATKAAGGLGWTIR